VAVGGTGVAVLVGTGVSVTVGMGRVGVSVAVGAGERVGNGVGTKNVAVGKGVNVGKSKLNNGVGVGCVPPPGKKVAPIVGVAEIPRPKTGIMSEQKQQNTISNEPGISILPSCPCRR
jgi:hypothetical protein